MFTNWLTNPTSSAPIGHLPSNLMTTPPDIILEVGPSPSVRFVAHSILLAMHSGYLRSAIRLDENGLISGNDLVIFLTNVTAEHFSPLLTYMYTGYLDLNVDNIFGVLLATHVLHMPRALEICRTFLSRAQSEGYLNGNFLTPPAPQTETSERGTNSKIIRPIASKATAPNTGFVAPPMPLVYFTSSGTPFKSLNPAKPDIGNANEKNSYQTLELPTKSPKINPTSEQIHPNDYPSSIVSSKKTNMKQKRTTEKQKKSLNIIELTPTLTATSRPRPPPSISPRKELQDNENKTIIDVASCDGPIRFRRVLNDAYGHQSSNMDMIGYPTQERSQQSVSLSFHQQMAKTISQHHQQQSDESENSEDLTKTLNNSKITNTQANNAAAGEIYSCVYCKHTFKSQYCYQKHAKRHLNPLSIDGGNSSSTETTSEIKCSAPITITSNTTTTTASSSSSTTTTTSIRPITPQQLQPQPQSAQSLQHQHQHQHQHQTLSDDKIPNPTSQLPSRSTIDLRREVRPLDMNVQYYPCKTCGCKFPSYYFVHKHRKLCHANEDASSEQSKI